MKKTTILLLGVLLASMLPFGSVQAQFKKLHLKVRTIDRAPIDTAMLYGFTGNTDTLCVDPTDARYNFAGTATTVTGTAGATLAISGDTVKFSSIPSTIYPFVVAVVVDVNDRQYIYGVSDSAGLNSGIFRASVLPDGDNNLIFDSVSRSNLLYPSSAENAVVAKDNKGYFYTSISATAAAGNSNPAVSLISNTPDVFDSILFPMSLHLNSYNVPGTINVKADSTVFIDGSLGGTIYRINTDDLTAGEIRISNVDSIGNIAIGTTHPWKIHYARVKNISLGPDPHLTIYDGKFATLNRETLTSYLDAGRFLYSNTDADASVFPWKVATDGFKVTFKNYNAQGDYVDSVARCEGGLIIPAAARPSYVAPEWLFQHYYTNIARTNPWFFDRDSVVSDTVLYAKWEYYDPTVNTLVRVNHYLQNMDDLTTYTLADSVDHSVLTAGPAVTFVADSDRFNGFYPLQADTLYTPTGTGTPDTINFYYDRKTYTLTWKLNYGSITGVTSNFGVDTVVNMLYGATIEYPIVNCPGGRQFSGWSSNIVYRTMPARNLTLSPNYSHRSRTSTTVWSGPDTVRYSGRDNIDTSFSAMVYFAPVTNHTTMVFIAGDTTIYSADDFVVRTNTGAPATEGAKHVYESPYTISVDTFSTTLTVLPYMVNAVDIEVQKVRYYRQGDQTAAVLNNGRPDVVLPGDNLTINDFVALYSDEEPGENKVITAYGITLGGTSARNYELVEDTLHVAFDGRILYFGLAQADTLTNGFDVTYAGYCVGTSQIQFHVDHANGATNPDMYSLNFASDRFVDVTSAPVSGNDFIVVNIPEGTPAGNYSVDVVFWHSSYPTAKSDPVTFTFTVNLPKDIIQRIFENVMTVMNTDPNMIIDTANIEWYHNDSLVGYGPFYKEEGGLTGEYYVRFSYKDSTGAQYTVRSCVQDDLVSYPGNGAKVAVKVYPNPTANVVNIAVENATQSTHTLRVMNIMGVTMLNTTFDGDATSIDFSQFGNGSYTVSVDGIVVRVIKK